MICKACGHENSDDSQYCSQCGLPLSVEEVFEDNAQRPVLNGVVPYVIEGQKTGAIPGHCEGEADAAEDRDASEEHPAQSGACDVEEASEDASGDIREDAPEDASENVSENSREDSSEGAPEDARPDGSDAGREEGAARESATGKDHEGNAESPRAKRPQGPAGLVSWDREFPTAQITAVMPQVADEGSSEDANACEAQDADAEADACPAKGEASEASSSPETPVGVDACPDAQDDSDQASDCEKAPCTGDSDDAEAGGGDTPSDTDGRPFAPAHARQGDAAGEGDVDDGDVDDSDDDLLSRSKHSGRKASHASAAEGGSKDEGDDPQESGPVFGRHSSSVDREAVTQRIRRVPGSAPDTTAVISSVSSKGSKSFSDAARDRADFVKKIPAKWFKIAAAVLAVILLAVAVKLLFFNTPIPQVVDSTSREARARLSDAGFAVEVRSEAVEGAEDGTVLACDPECGTRHRKGSTVTITVASSQTIPDVVGMDLESARQMLEEQGATNVKESLKKSNQPENTVIAVEPQVGTTFDLDDEIVLTVATTAYLPDVVGQSQDEAVKTLEDAGYEVSVKWTDSEEEPGKVVSTKPKPKELANLGLTVTVTVASPGPSDFMHIMEYFDTKPEDLSEYLKWKGFVVAGSYAYTNEWNGKDCVSQKWSRTDGATVSFTPAPYIEDNVLDVADYMAQGRGFEGVRIFIPAKSDASLGVDFTSAKVREYMEACGLEGMSDSCTQDDLDYNGKSGKDLGTGNFICAQGTQDGKVWTILITPEGTYIGAGGYECYEDMEPICDWVAVNEIFQAR